MSEFHAWITKQLQDFLGFDQLNEIKDHLLTIDDKEVGNYLQVSLLSPLLSLIIITM